MNDNEQTEAQRIRQMWQERLDKNELLFKQTVDAPMKVTVTPDGSVLIEYPFQLAGFDKAGMGSLNFTALAARTLKAVLNASDSVAEVRISDAGDRLIN